MAAAAADLLKKCSGRKGWEPGGIMFHRGCCIAAGILFLSRCDADPGTAEIPGISARPPGIP